jgi:hypothetical protein
VCRDLAENHHRNIAHLYWQDVSDCVGGIAQAKEELWEYAIPPLDEAIAALVVSLDGAYVLIRENGYREATVGNISLYDVTGKRQHTVYIGEAPEYGKGTFFSEFVKRNFYSQISLSRYPLFRYCGGCKKYLVVFRAT